MSKNCSIVCDIDSTLNNHWRRIRRHTINDRGRHGWPGTKIHTNAWTEEEVMKDMVLDSAVSSLVDLKVHYGCSISYLTARGWGDAKYLTERWLTEKNFPNPKDFLITPNMQHKIEVLKTLREERSVDIYIDDFLTGQEKMIPTFHKDIAQAIADLGIFVIPFRNDWGDVHNLIVRFLAGELTCQLRT